MDKLRKTFGESNHGGKLKRLASRGGFAEIYLPDALFSEAVQSLRSICTSLNEWLNKNRAKLVQHSKRRIVITLASSLYTDEEEKSVANELAHVSTKRRKVSARSPREQVIYAVLGAGSSNQAGPSNDTTRCDSECA